MATRETCPRKTNLIQRCDETAQAYSFALSELPRPMGTSTLKEYGDLYSSVNTSKAAINDQFKTGQRSHTQDTRLFYRVRGTRGKVIL